MCYLTTHSTHFIYGYMASVGRLGAQLGIVLAGSQPRSVSVKWFITIFYRFDCQKAVLLHTTRTVGSNLFETGSVTSISTAICNISNNT